MCNLISKISKADYQSHISEEPLEELDKNTEKNIDQNSYNGDNDPNIGNYYSLIENQQLEKDKFNRQKILDKNLSRRHTTHIEHDIPLIHKRLSFNIPRVKEESDTKQEAKEKLLLESNMNGFKLSPFSKVDKKRIEDFDKNRLSFKISSNQLIQSQ